MPTSTPTPVPTATPTPVPTATSTPTPIPLGPPPTSLGLDAFYKKYLDADGLPIVASEKVPDEALHRARAIIDELLAERPDIRNTLAGLGIRVAIISKTEVTTDIPEYSDLYEAFPGTDWDTRARGLGATFARPAVSAGEENILCYGDDPYPNEDVLVHEFAHTILNMGVEQQAGGREFKERLKAAYDAAVDAGLWEYTYAGSNVEEYWAEGVQSWYGLDDPPGSIHNDVNTRQELEEYDSALADLIREVLGDGEVTSSCHDIYEGPPTSLLQGTVLGPDGEPLEGIVVWAWEGCVKKAALLRLTSREYSRSGSLTTHSRCIFGQEPDVPGWGGTTETAALQQYQARPRQSSSRGPT